jgi:hypothetical protein
VTWLCRVECRSEGGFSVGALQHAEAAPSPHVPERCGAVAAAGDQRGPVLRERRAARSSTHTPLVMTQDNPHDGRKKSAAYPNFKLQNGSFVGESLWQGREETMNDTRRSQGCNTKKQTRVKHRQQNDLDQKHRRTFTTHIRSRWRMEGGGSEERLCGPATRPRWSGGAPRGPLEAGPPRGCSRSPWT